MTNPYFLMALLYLFVALLAALDASLTSLNLLAWFQGIRWLRVHFITLGVMTETLFGILPLLAAARAGLPRPTFRWDIWLTLNVGLVVLLAGIPSINATLIRAGGTLIFLAALLLTGQLWQMRSGASNSRSGSVKFYVTGLAYLLLGITVGTGLWLGWSGPLRIRVPLEVHIHANNWGFLSLVFAGLLSDIVPSLTGRPLAQPRTLTALFWGMTLGAWGLVLGPWLGGALWVTAPGLVLHLGATMTLVVLAGRALARGQQLRMAGGWHLLTAYVWILLPVLIAPLILLGVPGFPGAGIEATAPQALIYGWVLQFGLALIPYFAARYLVQMEKPQLGGAWLSLAAVNVGSALVWASIFIEPWQGILHGTAYIFYVIAMLPVAVQLGRMVQSKLVAAECDVVFHAGD